MCFIGDWGVRVAQTDCEDTVGFDRLFNDACDTNINIISMLENVAALNLAFILLLIFFLRLLL